MREALRLRMQQAVDEGRAAPLELALADWAVRHGAGEPVAVAFAACARAVADGHSCLSLDRVEPAIAGENRFCDRARLERALRQSDLVGTPGKSRPLVFDDGRLYLHRYWAYEARLAERLGELLTREPAAVDIAALQADGGLFDYAGIDKNETHWQALAAFVALRHRFAVISGGPGTGKTYTVLRLMCLLVGTALSADAAPPLIRLAAPTGKAAARMMESTAAGLESMALPAAVREHIPLEAQTLHRLIGIGRHTTRPRFDRDNPLAVDNVIVDEASMVDLPMMAKLVEALPDHARLILLGDRYQLASVESGSVLAELCNTAGINTFTPDQQTAAGSLLRRPMPDGDGVLADHVVTLQTSHRFRSDSPIGQLAAAVNAGDADKAAQIAQKTGQPAIELSSDTRGGPLDALVRSAAAHYETLISAKTPEAALHHLQAQCLLCALRRGPTGSHRLNRRITEELARRRGFDPDRNWYHGRPIIVTRNDYRAGLYNGDTGVCLRGENADLRVWFRTEKGPAPFLPTALPEHETAFAITVHKSQGSEFDHVTLVLPPEDNPILSRELLYTGITRARQTVRLFANQHILRTAIARRIERFSGLSQRLARQQ